MARRFRARRGTPLLPVGVSRPSWFRRKQSEARLPGTAHEAMRPRHVENAKGRWRIHFAS